MTVGTGSLFTVMNLAGRRDLRGGECICLVAAGRKTYYRLLVKKEGEVQNTVDLGDVGSETTWGGSSRAQPSTRNIWLLHQGKEEIGAVK
jgi:hypothetical protein